MLKQNINITFLTYGGKSDLQFGSLMNNIRVLPIKDLIKSRNRWIKVLKSLLLAFKLKKEMKEMDIIKTNQLEGSWVGWILKILYRKKLIVRGGFEWLKFYLLNKEDEKKPLIKFWLGYFWRFFIEFISYRLADEIFITNPVDIEFIIKKFKLKNKKDKIHLIYNFIDTDLFKPLNFDKYNKRILFIGRLNPQKNLINLIDAFKYLEGYSLDIIGEGSLKYTLSERARKNGINIEFLGEFPNKLLPELINKYQIFILPSYYEGNPKVLLETMSCGIACIGSDVWGINNIIEHQFNGYLCKTTPESIANAIESVYNDKAMRKKIGKNARQFVITNCSLESISNKEYSIYDKLLSKF